MSAKRKQIKEESGSEDEEVCDEANEGVSSTTEQQQSLSRAAAFKQLKRQRKDQKLNAKGAEYATAMFTAKNLYSKISNPKVTPVNQRKYAMEIHELLKPYYDQAMQAHDLSRVVQAVLKHSDPSIQETITELVSEKLLDLYKNIYANYCLCKLTIKPTKKAKDILVSFVEKYIKDLFAIQAKSKFINQVYSRGNAAEKLKMRYSLYNELDTTDNYQDFSTYCSGIDDNIGVITKTVQYVNKALTTYKRSDCELLHDLIYEVITKVGDMLGHPNDGEDSKPSKKEHEQLFTEYMKLRGNLKEHIGHLITSKCGNYILISLVSKATTKDRKKMVKLAKDFIPQDIIPNEHSYFFYMALFDCTDDTVMLQKVLDKLLAEYKNVLSCNHGAKIFEYILVHRDLKFFHPAIVELMEKHCSDSVSASRKPMNIRRTEIKDYFIPRLSDIIFNTDSSDFWFSQKTPSLVMQALFRTVEGEKAGSLFKRFATMLTEQKRLMNTRTNEEEYFVEHTYVQNMISILLHDDTAGRNGPSFSKELCSHLDEKVTWWFSINRICFMLEKLRKVILPSNDPDVPSDLPHKSVLSFLIKYKDKILGDSIGSKLLLELIDIENGTDT